MSADELRVAIAIRGGVSLAVWMGGACRELARLKQAAAGGDERGSVYGRLLEQAGYCDVTIDVLAGSSAGGLNSVLLASHLVYGVPFDAEIRDTWLQLGDLEGLTRSPDSRDVPSLLQGDAGFYRLLSERLTELAGREHVTPPRFLRLILTATRVAPRSDRLRPAIGTLFGLVDSRAHFRFRHRAGVRDPGSAALTDFAPPPGDGASRNRLAYAARATSSFPAAFEPALVRVDDTDQPLSFHGTSSETGRPQPDRAPYVELIDGGVLQNIPLNWSIRSIASAPASKPVDRWLVYLQPVPPEIQEDDPPDAVPRVTRLVRLVRRATALMRGGDSLLDDRGALDAANATAERFRALLEHGALPSTRQALTTAAAAPASTASYAELVARNEGRRLAGLLEDPTAVTAPDPFPLPGPPDDWDAVGAYPLGRLDAAGASAALLTSLRHDGLPTRPVTSPLALARAATLLLGWIRAVEHEAGASPSGFDDLRERAYLARFVAEVLLAARDRLVLATVADASAADVRVPALVVARADARLAAALAACPTPARLGGDRASETEWNGWAVGLHDALTGEGPGAGAPDHTPDLEARFREVWQHLAVLATAVGDQGTVVPPGFEALDDAAAAGPDAARAALLDAEILLGPLRPDPLNAINDIRLAIVSAASRSPLDAVLGVGGDVPDAEYVDHKLSGNQVANFAAFLSARWRAADWTWGRLDAARSLVEMVRAGSPDALIDPPALEAMFVDAAPGTQWAELLRRRWDSFDDERRSSPAGQVEILTERVQWEILLEEAPLLGEFAARANGEDLPPTDADLRAARAATERIATAPIPTGPVAAAAAGGSGDTGDGGDTAYLQRAAAHLGAIGSEPVAGLLRTASLRRSLLRLGLVAWRAVQPAGDGWARAVRWGLFAPAKPLVLLPLVLGVTAPLTTLASGLVTWLAIAISWGDWFSPPAHVVVAAGIGLACTSIAWQYTRIRLLPLVVAVASVVAAVVVGFLGDLDLPVTFAEDWGPWVRAAAVGVLCLLAAVLPVWSLAGPRALRTTRRDGTVVRTPNPSWLRHLGAVAFLSAAAAVLGFLAARVVADETSPAWALLVVYAPLVAESVVLTRFYPKAPEPPAPV